MRLRRQFNPNAVSWPNIAASDDDAHDPRLADEIAIGVPVQRCRHQSLLEAVDLDARIAQAGDFNDSAVAEMQPSPARQLQQVDTRGGDVLAEIAGPYGEARRMHFVEQLGVHQMHLAQIRLRRIPADVRTMLDGLAHMGVAIDAQSLDEPDAEARDLAEVMASAQADGGHAADQTHLVLRFAEYAREDGVDVLEMIGEVELFRDLTIGQIILYLSILLQKSLEVAFAAPHRHSVALHELVGVLAARTFLRQRDQQALRVNEAAEAVQILLHVL